MFSLDENQKPIDDGLVVPEPVVMPSSDSTSTIQMPVADTNPVVAPEPVTDNAKTTEVSDDLADLQKQAISELAPILGKLDLSNEDKFNTTMMMVQATDNKSLLSGAHEAAKAIEDDKVRAQALLDIINEINYFTQK